MANPSQHESTDASISPPPPKDLKDRLKASYDAIAPRYNEWTAHTNSNSRLVYLEELLPHLTSSNAPVSVLELGCGAGIPCTQKLASYSNISITANDLSSTQIALAKENLSKTGGKHVSFVESDMMALDLPFQAFDAIIALYSIIHLPRDEQVLLISRIAKWLKPGGFLLANFGADGLPGCEEQHWLEEDKGWMFWSSWGVGRTVELIKEAGLEIKLQVVESDEGDATFLWVVAKRPEVRI